MANQTGRRLPQDSETDDPQGQFGISMTALVKRGGTMSKRLLAKALMRMATQDIVRAPFAIKTLFPSALLYCASCVHVAVVKFLDWEKVELQDKGVSTEACHTVHLGKRWVDVFCRLQHCEKDAGYQEGVSANITHLRLPFVART